MDITARRIRGSAAIRLCVPSGKNIALPVHIAGIEHRHAAAGIIVFGVDRGILAPVSIIKNANLF